MSRRDTIIVAVLVNAGLLIVLFASALKSSSSKGDFATAPSSNLPEPQEMVVKKETSFVGGDEVDKALNQFNQPAVALAPPSVSNSQVLSSTASTSASSFAEDLEATTSLPSAPSMPLLTMPSAPQQNTHAEFIEVKVKKGDVLEKIARYHHTTVAEIMKVNKLASSNLRIGQVLRIPNKAIKKAEINTIATSQHSTHETVAVSDTTSKFYTVKKGDSPWTIAVKNHLKVEELLKLNNMNEEQARHLKPGDQLRIK